MISLSYIVAEKDKRGTSDYDIRK
jgi:hypothetical protein